MADAQPSVPEFGAYRTLAAVRAPLRELERGGLRALGLRRLEALARALPAREAISPHLPAEARRGVAALHPPTLGVAARLHDIVQALQRVERVLVVSPLDATRITVLAGVRSGREALEAVDAPEPPPPW